MGTFVRDKGWCRILLTYLPTYLPTYLWLSTYSFSPTYQMAIYKYISIYKYIIYPMGFTMMTKIWLVDKWHVHMDNIFMKSRMVFTNTNIIMGVVIFAMFWHSVNSLQKLRVHVQIQPCLCIPCISNLKLI